MQNQQFVALLLVILASMCSAAMTQAKERGHGIAPVEQPPVKKNTRSADKGICSVLAQGQYIDTPAGLCFGVGDSSWNELMTSIRSTSNTCVQVWQAKDTNVHEEYCGDDWIQLSDLSENVSRVCCILSDAQMTTKKAQAAAEAKTTVKATATVKAAATTDAEPTSGGTHAPLVVGCNGDGGSCTCGASGDGTALKMNHFFGNINAERVNGCQSNFQLTGSMWKAQWSAAESVGFDFEQQTAHHGLEGTLSV
jgi:hypothetical protein